MIHFNCFKTTGQKEIVSTGYIYDGKTTINMSSIYTKLIQEAGRFCDAYASDLLYDINTIESYIEHQKSTTRYIAFRRHGVDGNNSIKVRTPYEIAEYRAIYQVDIEFSDDNYYDKTIIVRLNEVYYSQSEHEWKELVK